MIGDLFRARAAALERAGRSRLYVELMRGAGSDADDGGVVAAVFEGDGATPGSVPELRLLAALHHLVLSGGAPQLARHYPSAGGDLAPHGVWAVARETIADHLTFVRERAKRTVQTNEPGRCVALYGGLLWLSERHRLPIRLLEIGASSGLNLHVERFGYVVGGAPLGDPASELVFEEPWRGAPVPDPPGAAARLRIAERAGCDQAPIDPTSADGRRALQSYIWPDEPERLARVALAAQVAALHPATVERRNAGPWLAERLADERPDMLTVVWQSVVNQYLGDDERAAIAGAFATVGTSPLAWLTLEPAPPGVAAEGFELRCRERPVADGAAAELLLGHGDYHGPPVTWRASAARAV